MSRSRTSIPLYRMTPLVGAYSPASTRANGGFPHAGIGENGNFFSRDDIKIEVREFRRRTRE